MKVRDLMTRELETVAPQATLHEAAQIMARLDVGVLPTVEEGRLVGIITDRDIAVRAVALSRDPNVTTVRETMSPGVKFIFDDDNVDDAAEVMADLQVRRLPVVDRENRVVGIVSLADIARERRPSKAGEALQGISRPGGQHNA
jgi:CBS domain-containing protein